MLRRPFAALLLCLAFNSPAFAAGIPEPLKTWEGWVLHNMEDKVCPPAYNNGDDKRCSWPTRLSLDLDAAGGKFDFEVSLYASSWVELPGGQGLWPRTVTVKSAPAPVTRHGGHPSLFLPKGAYRIQGVFAWDRLPEFLPVPASSGLLRLTLNGSEVIFPDFRGGRLWLKDQGQHEVSVEDHLDLKVYRRIEDMIPMRVITHMEIDVAGRQREVLLGPVLPPQGEGKLFVPLMLNSPLAAKLESGGLLRLQVRPGH